MSSIHVFKINDYPVNKLIQVDERLGLLINLIGDISLDLREDYFSSLIQSIIGQQLSAKAARTICKRVEEVSNKFSLENLRLIPDDDLRNVGVSRPKIRYIRDLCEKIISKEIQLDNLLYLEDSEVINTLTKIKGIGRWTSEMFLIFSLGRNDVISFGDAGLQRAAKWLYKMDEKSDGSYLEEHSDRWMPYRSIASLYLWRAIDIGLVDKYSTLEEVNEMKC